MSRTIHGQNMRKGSSKENTAWREMKRRCTNANCKDFKNYGGRGITFSDEWKEFKNFLRDMGYAPSPELMLERKDNNLGYSKENCIWATREQQNNNVRRNVKVLYNGEMLTVPQIARKVGLTVATIKSRLGKGYDLQTAIDLPLHKRK